MRRFSFTLTRFLLAIGALFASNGHAQSAPRSEVAVRDSGWLVVWSDEFNRDGLPDARKWDYEVGLVRNKEAQYYTRRRPENARVERGLLVIEARREPWQGSDYTSASLITLGKFGFQYGRVEVRAKLPAARGAWPAIWMLGEDRAIVGWPRCGELDILEHVGHLPGVVHGTVHQAKDSSGYQSKGGTVHIPTATSAFHTYRVDWTPQAIIWFVDDVEYFRFPYVGPTTWTFDRRMYLLLNLAVGGSWGGQQGIDAVLFPQRFEVDWVRVSQPVRWR